MVRNYKRHGVALISALLLLVILAVITTGFAQLMSNDMQRARKTADDYITLYTAEAGVEYAKWLIKHNMRLYPAVPCDTDNDAGLNTPEDPVGSIYNLIDVNSWGFAPGSLMQDDVEGDAGTTINANKFARENVFINDAAFVDDNFLHQRLYCATFNIRLYNSFPTNMSSTVTTASNQICSTATLWEQPPGWQWISSSSSYDLSSHKMAKELHFKRLQTRTVFGTINYNTSRRFITNPLGIPAVNGNYRDYVGGFTEWFR